MSLSPPLPYPALLAALPWHGDLFALKRPPLSRLRLEARLDALAPTDRAAIAKLERLVRWEEVQTLKDDAAALAEADAGLAALPTRFLQRLAAERLELRALIAALRRRAAGFGPPAREEPSGLGPRAFGLTRAWAQPDFGLGEAYAWLRQADALLRAGQSLALEKLLMGQAWKRLDRA